ncbi:MAG TPA: FUSC family protein [Jatrophihabitans sp.]|jgi:hypothetical protein
MPRWTFARSRADQLTARLRALGLKETLVIDREVFRRILKSTLAATLAWLAAELIDSPRPALASLAAIIVVQITVRATLTRSIQLTVAVTLGLGASLALGHLVGLHWWSITLVVLAGLIAGELLRLGTLSAQVSISAMLALSLGSGYGIERVIDTAIGALIGALVNALVVPPSHVSEAARTLRGIGEDLGTLLADIGRGIGNQPNPDTIHRWLQRARDLGADSRAAIGTVKQGEESLQFNPLARNELAQLSRLTEARRALDHAISQTRGITRSLLDLHQPIDDRDTIRVMIALGDVLTEAGGAVAGFGRLLEDPASRSDRLLVEQGCERARQNGDRVVLALAPLTAPGAPPAGPPEAELGQAESGAEPGAAEGETTASAATSRAAAGRLLSSVLVDADRLVREVDIISGVHRAAVAPGTNTVASDGRSI